jgi:hypothetical protein
MTMADIVEMLTVFWRSPPVPTMSIVGPGTSMRWACASMTSANPRISATDSPLTRSAMRKPASWMGVASPLMTSFMAHWACSRVRSEPPTRTVRRSGQVIRPRLNVHRGQAERAPRASDANRLGHLDGVQRVWHDSVGQRPRRQPPVLRTPGEDEHRRAVVDLVLEFAAEDRGRRSVRPHRPG